MRNDRVLWLLLAIGAVLRFWKLDGDLPYVFHYDEPTVINNAVWLLQNQTLDPQFFNYPTGLIYLLAALFGIVLLGGRLIGFFGSGADAIDWLTTGTYTRPADGGILYFYPTVGVPALFLIGRAISAIAGVATIGLIYAVVCRSGGNRRTARFSALCLAVSPLAVEHSHLITTDAAAMAMATWALLVAMRAEHGGIRSWIIAGALGGLAAGIKYNAGLVVLTLPLLAIWRWRTEPSRMVRPLACAALASVLAFLITTPYAVLDTATFFHDLGYEFRRVATVQVPFEGAEVLDVPAVDKIGIVLWHYLGVPGILAAIWGGVVAIRSRRFAGAAIVVWIVISLIPQLRWKHLYARYLLPIWPAIILLTAWGVTDLAGRVAGRLRGWKVAERFALVALAVIVLTLPTIRLVHRETNRLRPDPRPLMTEWIKSNVPEGERLALEQDGAFPSPEHYSLDKTDYLGRLTPDAYRSRGIRFLISSGREGRIEGEPELRFIIENLRMIRESSRCVWESGKYAVYLLEGGPSWDEVVRNARAAGDPAGARDILESEIQRGETTPHMWKTLAEVRVELGDTLSAIDAYLRGARQDTSDVEIPLALSNLHLQMRDWDQALAQLERAQRITRNDPLVHHNLAVAYLYRARSRVRNGERGFAREDWIAAGAHAATAAKFAPGDPDMTGVVGQVERMGQRWGFVESQ